MNTKALILLTTAAIAVSGCSPELPAASPPAVETTSPHVASLDLGKFAADPCQLLTIDQLNTKDDFNAPKPYEGPLGPTCIWETKDSKRPNYKVALTTKGKTLASLKEKAKSHKTFRETTVAGRPAFTSDFGDGKGTCTTTVGTSSQDAVVVSMGSEFPSNPEYPIACDISERVAAIVIEKLKG